jgi:hypothetical protein
LPHRPIELDIFHSKIARFRVFFITFKRFLEISFFMKAIILQTFSQDLNKNFLGNIDIEYK